MSAINTNYNNYTSTSLATLLNNVNTSPDNGTGNGNAPSLATLLDDNSSSGNNASLSTLLDDNSSSGGTDDLATLFEQDSGLRTYNLPTGSNGKAYIPTVDEMNNATTPDSKLTLAGYVSQAVLMQADASSKVGNASRATDITDQAQSVLNAVSSAITDLANSGSIGLSGSQQTTISSTLNAINSTLSEVGNLLPKADAATQTSVATSLANLDSLASSIATETGVSWTSVTGNESLDVTGYSASVSAETSASSPNVGTTSSLVNILA